MERLSAASREEVRLVQAQLDEQKEKWRKEQQDSHKNAKEKLSELERAQSTIHSLQEEVQHWPHNLNIFNPSTICGHTILLVFSWPVKRRSCSQVMRIEIMLY